MYTSYASNYKNIPAQYNALCISRSNYGKFPVIEELVPNSKLVWEYKNNMISAAEYKDKYYTNNLNKLDPHRFMEDLSIRFGNTEYLVLMCVESYLDKDTGDIKFCHRHIVSEWLRRHGYDIKEFIKPSTLY